MITPYKDSADPKVDQVRRMFNRIAPQYDRLNLVISLGLDRSWRRKALSFLAPYAPKHVLDVATGTGDVAISLVQTMPSVKKVTGIDISEEMMRIGADVLLGVGEDVCPMLLHEAVELGDEVGIEELGAEEALGARLEDLPAVEGHEVATVVRYLQSFGQGTEGWGGAPRSEDDAGVVVSLGTEQGRADALGEDVLLGDQRAVNIKC